MIPRMAAVSLSFFLLAGWGVSAQQVPVADGATAEGDWPMVEELGVPLYADFQAYLAGVPPMGPFGGGENPFRFVNFASQADVSTLLAWFSENAKGWEVDVEMGMMFPEGSDANAAMMGRAPFVNFMDMSEIGGMCMSVSCKTMVQVVYEPNR